MLILGTFFSETKKHRTMNLYIATFPLSMPKLCFSVNIGENLVPFMGINILINVKSLCNWLSNYYYYFAMSKSFFHINQYIYSPKWY